MNESSLGLIDISASSIFSGIIFGIIGWYIYKHGRANSDIAVVMTGIALMVYPYFTKGPLQDWGIGFAFCGLAYYLIKK